MNAGRSSRVLAAVAVAVLGLTACVSTPSAKRVALDVVETLDVSDSVKACMRDVIDEYDADELEDIAEAAADGDRTELTRFEARLRTTCPRS